MLCVEIDTPQLQLESTSHIMIIDGSGFHIHCACRCGAESITNSPPALWEIPVNCILQ